MSESLFDLAAVDPGVRRRFAEDRYALMRVTVSEWVPNEREALWRASYKQAAMDADDANERRVAPVRKQEKYEDTILHRMRRNAPELFSDGVYPKE